MKRADGALFFGLTLVSGATPSYLLWALQHPPVISQFGDVL